MPSVTRRALSFSSGRTLKLPGRLLASAPKPTKVPAITSAKAIALATGVASGSVVATSATISANWAATSADERMDADRTGVRSLLAYPCSRVA